MLTTACECTDRLVQIRAAMDADGIVLTELSGRKDSHPLIAAEQWPDRYFDPVIVKVFQSTALCVCSRRGFIPV